MTENDANPPRSPVTPQSPATQQVVAVPVGYRQGIITAITVLLGFSLTFFRFWGLEAPGKWTIPSVIAATTVVLAVVLQIVALFRSLRIEDDDAGEYRKTVRWFVVSAAVLLVGLVLAVVVSADAD